jgi:hypothetical protein
MSVAPAKLEFKAIVGWIQAWLISKKDYFPDVYLDKGGWEGWAQTEIATFLKTHELPGSPSIHREHGIFNDSKSAVDFCIVQQEKVFCIEIKCESLFQSSKQGRVNSDHRFYEEVEADIWKLSMNRKTELAKQPAMIIAFCFSDEACVRMKRIADDHEEFVVGPKGTWKIHMFTKIVTANW